MAILSANAYNHQQLIKVLNECSEEEIEINELSGHRYIACGWKNNKRLILKGTAGNNLGAFSEGPEITLYGNAQEGVANTMSNGRIVVHGRVGDIAAYAMRGGELFVKEDAGYRLGIHMKAYQDKKPLIVVGGSVGAFTGEYMAGGIIIILGLYGRKNIVGPYCGTGMYEGDIYIRGNYFPRNLASNIKATLLSTDEMEEIKPYLEKFAGYFDYPLEEILDTPFTRLNVIEKRPFAHLYAGYQ